MDNFHVCNVPVWEYDVYWHCLRHMREHKTSSLNNILTDLNDYSVDEIKEAVDGLLKDKMIKRLNKGLYEYIEKK